jgi:hypothetical protein
MRRLERRLGSKRVERGDERLEPFSNCGHAQLAAFSTQP